MGVEGDDFEYCTLVANALSVLLSHEDFKDGVTLVEPQFVQFIVAWNSLLFSSQQFTHSCDYLLVDLIQVVFDGLVECHLGSAISLRQLRAKVVP